MRFCYLFLLASVLLLPACVSRPPRDVNNICRIFNEYPRWHRDAKDVEKRWRVPVPVLMAIMHQESKFDAVAAPPRNKLLWIIPWKRPTTAYGYSQALRGTWVEYKHSDGNLFSARDNFGDAADFIGWYANIARRQAGISQKDAYTLYLAYHEGIGGYRRRTYLQKHWLVQVAHKVKARAASYQAQLERCNRV